MSWNVPDDWNSWWEYCDRHKHRYHASEWCPYCEAEDDEESSEEESSEDPPRTCMRFRHLLNKYLVAGRNGSPTVPVNDDDDDCDILCFCRECLN